MEFVVDIRQHTGLVNKSDEASMLCYAMLSCFCHVRLAPLSMGFSRQEYWSGLPCPPLRYFPHLPLLHLLDCFVGLFSPPSPSEAPA